MVNWNDPKSRVSKYFTVKDVTKGDARRTPKNLIHKHNVKKLAKKLDKLTEAHGNLVVTSWYRDPVSNVLAGGASNSQHLVGLAADIYLARKGAKKQKEFESFLDRNWKGGVGRGMGKLGFVHVDLGPNRRWDY